MSENGPLRCSYMSSQIDSLYSAFSSSLLAPVFIDMLVSMSFGPFIPDLVGLPSTAEEFLMADGKIDFASMQRRAEPLLCAWVMVSGFGSSILAVLASLMIFGHVQLQPGWEMAALLAAQRVICPVGPAFWGSKWYHTIYHILGALLGVLAGWYVFYPRR
jgi:hypothetical protein